MTGSAINAVTALVLLWLLNVVLGKEGFGNIILALVVLDTITSVVSSGFVSVVLYRVSRLGGLADGQTYLGRSMLGTVLVYGSLLSSLVALAVALLSTSLATLFGKHELQIWLYSMAIIIPLDCARRMLIEGCRAQQRIQLAVFYTDILPGLLKLAGVGVVYIVAARTEALAYAYIFAQAIAVLGLLWVLRPIPSLRNSAFSRSDFYYGLKLTFNRLANEPSRTIDVMIIGALTSAGVTAEYALGSRLAKLLVVLKTAFARLLIPRLGLGIEKKDRALVNREYYFSRLFSLIATLIGITGIAAIGPYALSLFGEYAQAFPILMILSAAMVVRVGVGSSGGYLNMAGYAGFTLISTVMGMIVNIILAVLLVPTLSGTGGALSVLLATIVVQVAIGVFLFVHEGFAVIDRASALAVALSLACALLAAFGVLSHWVVAPLFALVTVGYVLANRAFWLPLLPARLRNR